MIPVEIILQASDKMIRAGSSEDSEFVPDEILELAHQLRCMERRSIERFFSLVEELFNQSYDTL